MGMSGEKEQGMTVLTREYMLRRCKTVTRIRIVWVAVCTLVWLREMYTAAFRSPSGRPC